MESVHVKHLRGPRTLIVMQILAVVVIIIIIKFYVQNNENRE